MRVSSVLPLFDCTQRNITDLRFACVASSLARESSALSVASSVACLACAAASFCEFLIHQLCEAHLTAADVSLPDGTVQPGRSQDLGSDQHLQELSCPGRVAEVAR